MFVGSSVYKVDRIVSVKDLMDELVSEAEKCMSSMNPDPVGA